MSDLPPIPTSDPSNPHARHGSSTSSVEGSVPCVAGYAVLGKMRWRTPKVVLASLAKRLGISWFDLDAAADDLRSAHAPRWLTPAEDCLAVPDWRRVYRAQGLEDVFTGISPERLRGRLYSTRGEWPGSQPIPGADQDRIQHVFINPPWAPAGLTEDGQQAGHLLGLSSPKPFPGTAAFAQKAHEQSRLGMTVAVLLPQALDTAWQRRLVVLADEVLVGPRVRFADWQSRPGPQPPGGVLVLIFRPHVPVAGWSGGPRVDWSWDPAAEAAAAQGGAG